MSRKYKVITTVHKDGHIIEYFVSDISSDELKEEEELKHEKVSNDWRTYQHSKNSNERIRPRIATFPVSPLHDANDQLQRATMLMNYLNKIQEATDKAIRNTTLIDALSIGNP